MITQSILNLMGRTIIGIVGLIPGIPPDVQANIASMVTSLGTLAGQVAMFGVIIPWSMVWAASKVFLGAWLAAAVIYMVRFLMSLVTGGGGR